MIGSYRGTQIDGLVASQKPLGGSSGDGNIWTTSSSGVAGIDALYVAAGDDLADGDMGIINTGGSPVVFYYSTAARNWTRTNPIHNSSQQYFPEASKTNGFRVDDVDDLDWTTQNYTYSPPDHIMNSASSVNGFVYTNDLAFTMSEIGFMVVNKAIVATGATSTPIFDLRRNVSGTSYNLRLYVSGGNWAIQSSTGGRSLGVAYSQNTEYTFEVYYNYSNNRCWVWEDYTGSTSVFNTSFSLPTTGGTASALALQNLDGELTVESLAYGHLISAV
jgi:hypothetical protein